MRAIAVHDRQLTLYTVPIVVESITGQDAPKENFRPIGRESGQTFAIFRGFRQVSPIGSIGSHCEQIPVARCGSGPVNNPAFVVNLAAQIGAAGV